MKSIDSMYDNLFNSDKLDKMFENLKYENNPITQPIDEMTQQIFNTNQKPSGPTYVKAHDDQSVCTGENDFVVGEPLYQNSGQNLPVNPYANMNSNISNNNYFYGQPQANPTPYNNKKLPKLPDNYTNPYYQVPQAGQYYGDWSKK